MQSEHMADVHHTLSFRLLDSIEHICSHCRVISWLNTHIHIIIISEYNTFIISEYDQIGGSLDSKTNIYCRFM